MKSDNKWYLRHNKYEENNHSGHLPISSNHLQMSILNIDNEALVYIDQLLSQKVDTKRIADCVSKRFNINLSYDTIRHYHRMNVLHIIDKASKQPYGTPVDQLLHDFERRPDVSYIYVIHSIDSGFVTHYKGMSNSYTRNNETYISVYQDEVETWRRLLQISGGTQILVAFAWCHDEQIRLTRMFPEFLACDVTFGVTKEQRNLLMMVGIDGNNKIFPAMHCFMPSKELRAFNWAFNVALPFLLTPQSLKYNQTISTDSELAMYQPLRAMMDQPTCLENSNHRLDKYHLFSKPWKEKVTLKIGKRDDIHDIVHALRCKIEKLFNYTETKIEMNICIKDYKTYYSKNKNSFENVALCEAIEDILISLDNNLRYFAHCYFIDTTTFDFVGDSIAEAFNSGLKCGKDHVTTNMTINTSASQQIAIVNKQIQMKQM